MDQNPTLLSVKHLQTGFHSDRGYFPAIKGISFSIQRGESLGMVGESGSGKSLTALSLLRLTDHLPGCVMKAEGILYTPENREPLDLSTLDRTALRKIRGKEIGLIFQDPSASLNPVFTCGDQLVEVLRLHMGLDRSSARDAAMGWLEKVQLTDIKRIFSSYPHQLSGGQKQRVCIAIALAAGPRLLIADEPTTSLDVTVQKRILELIRGLRAETGMSMLFISHDLGVVAEMTERILVMQQGEIVEEGLAGPLFQHPHHPYTRQLLASRPPLDIRLKRLPVLEGQTAQKLGNEAIEKRQLEMEALPPLLRVEGLEVRYEQPRSGLLGKRNFLNAVAGVDLHIAPGETLGVVGESGCGKTSLGKAIIRLVDAYKGKVFLEGQELLGLPEAQWRSLRRKAQIIFQDPYQSLNPRMPVGEAILEPMAVHGIGKDRREREEETLRWLARVGMDESHFFRYPHELSGGQRQRIGIARALAIRPRLLICDECVSALDVTVQAQILNLLLDLQEASGFSMLFISHDWAVVRFISDRVMVMREGKVLESGPSEEIWTAPGHAYTKELIAAVPNWVTGD
ncbi:MAG: ABC transporter ATP-binding protein [Saprospirales bacterium]|nr:ABC transporter ATP-binding protein [Saprospirales bacterium]